MVSQLKINELEGANITISEEIRPRAFRELGIPLEWDVAIDTLPRPKLNSLSNICAKICIVYRHLRPNKIGNRCAFEPSCSRYSEVCFRCFGFRKGLRLTLSRLHRCGPKCGGVDLPPLIESNAAEIKEIINAIQN